MKGIAHFATGLAVASFFPGIIHSAAQSQSFGLLLGGFAGLLPDTLDFKFIRYFERVDDEIDPAIITTSAGHPDPQAIAGRIAEAMNRAFERDAKIKIQLHTLRLGADLWRQYSVTLDASSRQVLVRMGPVVTTGQVPYAGSEIHGPVLGQAHVDAPILHTYDAETKIDIFSGPSLAFERVNGAVRVTFVPWHRVWTHSLLMVLLLGAVGALIAPVYGLAMALAGLAHVLVDQMGYMGCNLLFPVKRSRTPGLRWMRSGDAIPNFLMVWISLAILFLNMDRFSETPSIPLWPYLLSVVLLPCLLFLGLAVWDNLGDRQAELYPHALDVKTLAAVEALDETSEVDI
jgi:membrane-bound metal-dependent hydrolase YbcI (DUF457 family)